MAIKSTPLSDATWLDRAVAKVRLAFSGSIVGERRSSVAAVVEEQVNNMFADCVVVSSDN